MFNTHNGELPGHIRWGEGPEPEATADRWEYARAMATAAEAARLNAEAKAFQVAQVRELESADAAEADGSSAV